jgi:DNA-binding GntR family transcriptional regulator
MNITPYRTKRDVAADLLREAIIVGELAPGARLVLEELSQRYELSMTPIREAFSVLEGEGLVVQSPHRGAVVATPDRDELLELYAIRGAIEELAARHGVPRLSDADIGELERLFAQLADYQGARDPFLDIDKQFHRVIYRAAGSRRWLETIETFWQRSRRYMLASTAVDGAVESLRADHQAILDACRARDAERAAVAVRAHLKRSELRLLEQWS